MEFDGKSWEASGFLADRGREFWGNGAWSEHQPRPTYADRGLDFRLAKQKSTEGRGKLLSFGVCSPWPASKSFGVWKLCNSSFSGSASAITMRHCLSNTPQSWLVAAYYLASCLARMSESMWGIWEQCGWRHAKKQVGSDNVVASVGCIYVVEAVEGRERHASLNRKTQLPKMSKPSWYLLHLPILWLFLWCSCARREVL
jgi:hypothetical protein